MPSLLGHDALQAAFAGSRPFRRWASPSLSAPYYRRHRAERDALDAVSARSRYPDVVTWNANHGHKVVRVCAARVLQVLGPSRVPL
jgi:hypothetical protein